MPTHLGEMSVNNRACGSEDFPDDVTVKDFGGDSRNSICSQHRPQSFQTASPSLPNRPSVSSTSASGAGIPISGAGIPIQRGRVLSENGPIQGSQPKEHEGRPERMSQIGAIAFQNAVSISNIETTQQATAYAQNVAPALFTAHSSKTTVTGWNATSGYGSIQNQISVQNGFETQRQQLHDSVQQQPPVSSPLDQFGDDLHQPDEIVQMKHMFQLMRGLFPPMESKYQEAVARASRLDEENRRLKEKVARLEDQMSKMKSSHQHELREIESMYAQVMHEHEKDKKKLEMTSANLIASMASPGKEIDEVASPDKTKMGVGCDEKMSTAYAPARIASRDPEEEPKTSADDVPVPSAEYSTAPVQYSPLVPESNVPPMGSPVIQP